MVRRRLSNTEAAEYTKWATAVAGWIILVPGLIWQLWYVIVKGSIPIGTMKGTTFASNPLSFSLYILSSILILTLLIWVLIIMLQTRRRDKIKSAEAANSHIAQISDAANNQRAK